MFTDLISLAKNDELFGLLAIGAVLFLTLTGGWQKIADIINPTHKQLV
jgi:hypothetical protein